MKKGFSTKIFQYLPKICVYHLPATFVRIFPTLRLNQFSLTTSLDPKPVGKGSSVSDVTRCTGRSVGSGIRVRTPINTLTKHVHPRTTRVQVYRTSVLGRKTFLCTVTHLPTMNSVGQTTRNPQRTENSVCDEVTCVNSNRNELVLV